jgi:hypothetical protein
MPDFDPRGPLARYAETLSVDLSDLVRGLKRSTAETVARATAALVNAAVTIALGGKQEQPLPWNTRSEQRSWHNRQPSTWPFRVLHEESHEVQDEDDLWRRQWEDEPEAEFDEPLPTREPAPTTVSRRWLEPALAVLQAAILWLRNRKAPLPMIAFGTSLVGLVALLLGGSSGPVTALLAVTEILVAGSALLRA